MKTLPNCMSYLLGSCAVTIAMFYATVSFGQEFSIRQIELAGPQVIVHYDLLDTTRGHTYSIYLYASRDNFLAPLEKVSGDLGLEVKPGLNRKIVWNAKEELGASVPESIELEVRGRLYIPFIRFEGFQDIEVRKRATPFHVKWSGGTRQNILNIQLFQRVGERELLRYNFPNAGNTGEHRIVIPASVKPGKDYFFKISDTRNKDQVVVTPAFQIRRKYPLALKALPLAAGVAIVLNMWLDSEPEDVSGPPKLPTSK